MPPHNNFLRITAPKSSPFWPDRLPPPNQQVPQQALQQAAAFDDKILVEEAKAELPARLEYQCRRINEMFPSLSVHYNKVFIKNNRSNWGSCSFKGNINLNMHLVNLPDELRDFVIIHELCHLVHRNHGAQFHRLVDAACGGKEKEYSRQLRKYKLS